LKRIVLLLFVLWYGLTSKAQTKLETSSIDEELLNSFILKEINEIRKKEKVDSLNIEALLAPAANDHADYMSGIEKTTHFQKDKAKKSPKNRVDFYGQQFSSVGENVQLANVNLIPKELKKKIKTDKIESYEDLAKVLVTNWKNSPPHFANIIRPEFTNTYTSIKIGPNGEIYACQLFGSNPYEYPEEFEKEVYKYKPENEKKCKRCRKGNSVGGQIVVGEDGTIAYYSNEKKSLRKLIKNPFTDAIAADIVLKEQYPCGGENVFNGYSGVRGIPLDPVFKKGFRAGSNMFRKRAVYIELGKLPEWVDQDYEVNLTLVNKKRTCSSIIFHTIPASLDIKIPILFDVDTVFTFPIRQLKDTLEYRVNFDRSQTNLNDSTIYRLIAGQKDKINKNTRAVVHGYASIEGTSEENARLFRQRAEVIREALIKSGCDSSKIELIAEENFKDFRRDIKNTPFNYLSSLSDIELKERLKKQTLLDSIDYLLKQHRYADLKFFTNVNNTIKFDPESAKAMLDNSMKLNDMPQIQNLLAYFNQKALNGEITKDQFDEIKIPEERNYVPLMYQHLLVKDRISDEDSLSKMNDLKRDLSIQFELSPKNKEVNTYLDYITYLEVRNSDLQTIRDYYDTISKRKSIDKTVQSRMLLQLAANNDVTLFFMKRKKKFNFYFPKMKKLVHPAELSVDETFQVASFYTFFGDYKYAYDLIKNQIDKTDDPAHLVFFLKLIKLTDVGISENKQLDYFRKIKLQTGDKFCELFNSPQLNFQFLDDEKVKAIYCEQCYGIISTKE